MLSLWLLFSAVLVSGFVQVLESPGKYWNYNVEQSCNKYLGLKYKYKYLYLKYKYKYKYHTCKYKYKYKYLGLKYKYKYSYRQKHEKQDILILMINS